MELVTDPPPNLWHIRLHTYRTIRPRQADGYYEITGNIKVWHETKA